MGIFIIMRFIKRPLILLSILFLYTKPFYSHSISSLSKKSSSQFLRSKRGIFESVYKTRKEIVAEECSTFKSGPCKIEEVQEVWEGASSFNGDENGREHHIKEQFNDWKHPCNKFPCQKDNTIGKRERSF